MLELPAQPVPELLLPRRRELRRLRGGVVDGVEHAAEERALAPALLAAEQMLARARRGLLAVVQQNQIVAIEMVHGVT